jgi:hypothetical protein
MQVGSDSVHHSTEACADGLQTADDDDGNKRRNQTILDGRRTGITANEVSKKIVHDTPYDFETKPVYGCTACAVVCRDE